MIFGKHINRYYLKYGIFLLIGLLADAFVDWMQLGIPEVYRITVNGINNGAVEIDGATVPFTMSVLLDEVCLPLFLIILSLLLGRFLWRVCFFGSAIKTETDLRSRMFDRCKDLSQRFYNENKVGGLMSLFTNDLETVQDCFGSGILMLADVVLLGGFAIIKMARMNLLLTGLSLIPMFLLLFIGMFVSKAMTRKWDARQAAFSEISDFTQESFSGIAVIKAFVCEVAELMSFRKLNEKNEKTNVDYTKVSVLMNIMVTLFVESIICVILGYGGYLVHEGVFNAGELVEFIGYFGSVVWPIMAISELIDMSSRGKASLNRISELLDTPTEVVDAEDVEDVEHISGSIEMKDLSFTYPGTTKTALRHVSFRIDAGENVGIIGKTGSGKTTIADLILRTYNVPDGCLFVDGRDVNKIPIRTLRKFAAYVPQDNFLFSDTIENNIAFASDMTADTPEGMDAVIAAAKDSDVDGDVTEFPLGYKTVLGERGVTVSGGQKQRISIARALMKNASILILDDSVSAVDTRTERLILDALRAKRSGKTTILIAHRVSTIEQMDKIIYVEDGTVIAAGTHEELLVSCPQYRKTVELQRLEDSHAASGGIGDDLTGVTANV